MAHQPDHDSKLPFDVANLEVIEILSEVIPLKRLVRSGQPGVGGRLLCCHPLGLVHYQEFTDKILNSRRKKGGGGRGRGDSIRVRKATPHDWLLYLSKTESCKYFGKCFSNCASP